MFVDSHCHLDFPQLREEENDVLAAMAANQVGHALCISVTLEDFPQVLAIARKQTFLSASVGVHPDNSDVIEPGVEDLVQAARDDKVVAIGETGLDYHWHKDRPLWQRERFRVHIRAARQSGCPLVIHTREAAEDTLMIMREEKAHEVGGVMHCFTENREIAQAALDLGFYVSFSGVVTFKNAAQVKEVACYVPEDRLLIETDAPYLAPAPHRGKTNQPAWVVHVAEELARLRGQPLEHIAAVTTENFFRLFHKAHRS